MARYYLMQDGKRLVSDSLAAIRKAAQSIADATGKGVVVGLDDGPFPRQIAATAKPKRKSKAKAPKPMKRTPLKRGKPLKRRTPLRSRRKAR